MLRSGATKERVAAFAKLKSYQRPANLKKLIEELPRPDHDFTTWNKLLQKKLHAYMKRQIQQVPHDNEDCTFVSGFKKLFTLHFDNRTQVLEYLRDHVIPQKNCECSGSQPENWKLATQWFSTCRAYMKYKLRRYITEEQYELLQDPVYLARLKKRESIDIVKQEPAL